QLLTSASLLVLGAYSAVSPHNAPRQEYNSLFKRNLGLLGASLVGPALYSFLVYDGRKANANTYVQVVTHAFFWGYLTCFTLEVLVATVFQLGVLRLMEPDAFKLCPEVPGIFLPWVMR
ncbi:unnamed protein product, partial [Discosporangium mesarthrocarpum]